MAICSPIDNGIAKSCSNNAGGVSKIYITDFDNVTGITASGGTVSSITMSDSFYEFVFNKNTSEFNENAQINLENGSTFFEQTVILKIPRREVSKRNVIEKLVAGQKDLIVIVKDANSLYWLLGEDNGMNVTTIESAAGVAKEDGSNYTITILSQETDQAKAVDPSIIAGLVA